MCDRLLAAGLLVVLFSSGALAQTAVSVVGSVVDETNAVLPGVAVTATDIQTGRQFSDVTNERGQYRLVNMQAGRYRIQAELQGFATVVMPDVELLVGQTRTVQFGLKVATVAETLTVMGEAPIVDTRTTQVAGNVDRRQMEELPISGRNWMELTMLVKGVTANDVAAGRPGVARDGEFQMNLDGQQISQAVSWTSSFGQPGLSREAIAEYQVVTNMFDITQGRSTGIQVQAISRAGTNSLSGSVYGYFRDDSLNAKDFFAKTVIPFQNQQVGGSVGGPIIRDKVQYFATYEYERQPGTFVARPPGYSRSISLPTKVTHHRFLARGDWQVASKDHLSVRFTNYYAFEPFGGVFGADYPTNGSYLPRDNHATTVNWSRVIGSHAVQELKGSFFHYHWNHTPAAIVPNTPLYQFPGFRIGGRPNYPEEFWQNTPAVRYDLQVNRGSHNFKVGGEFLKWRDTGWWQLRVRGLFQFSALPPDLERRFPLEAWNDPTQWDLSGLDSSVLFFERNFAREGGQFGGNCPNPTGCGDWSLDIPRPNTALWLGDTWNLNSRLTVNLGVRYDLDYGAMAPPLVRETDVVIDNGLFSENVGYRTDIRDYNNVSPRGGINYDVTGDGRLVIRGGSGLYYMSPVSELAFVHQMFNGQRVLANSFRNDGQPGFLQDPMRGVTEADVLDGRVPLPPQAVFVIDPKYRLPYTWQSTVGFQKQIGNVMGIDADVTYYRGLSQGQNRDPNLFYDPNTGYNRNPSQFGRPRPDYAKINLYYSEGRSDGLSLATAFTRRFRNNYQYGLTYTLMFFRHDTGTYGGGYGGWTNNHFDIGGNDEWATSLDYQRHTLRMNGIVNLPYGFSMAGAYFLGSGNPYATLFPGDPTGGATGVNRLRPDFTVVPRNAIEGDAIHKVDLRLTKEFRLVGNLKLAGIAEVFNLFNHKNYGAYVGLVGTATYGQPVQNVANTYQPRTGQLAFRLAW